MKKREPILFLVVALLHVIPVVYYKFFFTIDGPSHLYNATLIEKLLLHRPSELNDFFSFSGFPYPNWSGHLFMVFFKIFLPGYLAEKILQLFLVAGLAYSFRALIKKRAPQSIMMSYLVFPLTYPLMLTSGYYNFCLGIICMLISLNYWNTIRHSMRNLQAIVFFLLCTITYFSHSIPFGFLLLIVAAPIAIGVISGMASGEKKVIDRLFSPLNLKVFFAVLPSLLLFILFYASIPDAAHKTFLPREELVDMVINMKLLVRYGSDEQPFARGYFIILSAVFLIAVYHRINSTSLTLSDPFIRRAKASLQGKDIFFVAAIVALVGYFVLPDSDGYAGFVSARMCYLFFLFLIIWIAVQEYPRWFMLTTMLCVLYFSFQLLEEVHVNMKPLNKVSEEVSVAGEKVPAGAVVFTMNFSDHWMLGHVSNVLGADKPMVILENYECNTGYFPLQWNQKRIPSIILGNMEVTDNCTSYWSFNSTNPPRKADFVFVLGRPENYNDSCNQRIKEQIRMGYREVFKGEQCMLYQSL